MGAAPGPARANSPADPAAMVAPLAAAAAPARPAAVPSMKSWVAVQSGGK